MGYDQVIQEFNIKQLPSLVYGPGYSNVLHAGGGIPAGVVMCQYDPGSILQDCLAVDLGDSDY